MHPPTLVPIEYQGELVALVSPTRIHIIAPSLRDRPEDDYDRRFVTFMCLCCSEALNGRFPGEYSNAAAATWAERAIRAQGTTAEPQDMVPVERGDGGVCSDPAPGEGTR